MQSNLKTISKQQISSSLIDQDALKFKRHQKKKKPGKCVKSANLKSKFDIVYNYARY